MNNLGCLKGCNVILSTCHFVQFHLVKGRIVKCSTLSTTTLRIITLDAECYAKCWTLVGPKLVKFLSLLNDSELYWSYGQIIFLTGEAGQGGLSKDATMARRSLVTP